MPYCLLPLGAFIAPQPLCTPPSACLTHGCPPHARLALQGDLFSHLMDAAEPEFALHAGSVPLLQLQSLLESAVRGSSAAADPDAARLAAAFDHRTIINMLVENQKALAAVPGTEAAGKTPFSKVGRVWGRGSQTFRHELCCFQPRCVGPLLYPGLLAVL